MEPVASPWSRAPVTVRLKTVSPSLPVPNWKEVDSSFTLNISPKNPAARLIVVPSAAAAIEIFLF